MQSAVLFNHIVSILDRFPSNCMRRRKLVDIKHMIVVLFTMNCIQLDVRHVVNLHQPTIVVIYEAESKSTCEHTFIYVVYYHSEGPG
jgi:hypothetical protein